MDCIVHIYQIPSRLLVNFLQTMKLLGPDKLTMRPS